jgi:hypothetical protein
MRTDESNGTVTFLQLRSQKRRVWTRQKIYAGWLWSAFLDAERFYLFPSWRSIVFRKSSIISMGGGQRFASDRRLARFFSPTPGFKHRCRTDRRADPDTARGATVSDPAWFELLPKRVGSETGTPPTPADSGAVLGCAPCTPNRQKVLTPACNFLKSPQRDQMQKQFKLSRLGTGEPFADGVRCD